tara:strand:- start:643 stop:945 length:303 start_codon:yes stop_codon:yes gene_type:complete
MNINQIKNAGPDISWEIAGRVSMGQLKRLVERLNITKGYSVKPYETDHNGKFTANVGTYYVQQAYGGYRLEQICNTSGGARDISHRGTKKEVYLATMELF